MSLDSRQRRWVGLGAAAAAAAALIYAGPARDVVQSRAASRPADSASPASAAPVPAAGAPAPGLDPDLVRAHERRERREGGAPIRDAFAPHSWTPPPAEPPAVVPQPPAPPPAPVAPQLPYRYLGQLSEQGRTVVFLARGEAPVAGSVGEILEGTYRIERIAATEVEFTYLPLRTRQVLPVGGVQ